MALAVSARSTTFVAQPKQQSQSFFGSTAPLRPVQARRPTIQRDAVVPLAVFGRGGSTKTKQAYICLDCGYIYDEGDFNALPSSYRCPVCRAPKRRFGPYEKPVARNANDLKVRKARKAQLQGGSADAGIDESDGKNLGIFVAAGAAVLGALYFFLQSQY